MTRDPHGCGCLIGLALMALSALLVISALVIGALFLGWWLGVL